MDREPTESDRGRLWDFDESDRRHPYGPLVRPSAARSVGAEATEVVLCLSGGGYRAAAYHLGALQRLNELGLLSTVHELRAVSGGSLLAAWLAVLIMRNGGRWPTPDEWEEVVAVPFRRALQKDVRSWPILAATPVNALWKIPRLRLVENRLGRWLGDESGELPSTPRFVFIATDLLSGRQVELPDPSTEGWTLSRLALTSASFPPFFGPRLVRTASGTGRFALVDGGVWGNLGVTNEVLTRAALLLVSDASYPLGPVRFVTRPRIWFARSLRVAVSRGDAVLRGQLWMEDAPNRRSEVWRIDQTSNVDPPDLAGFEYSRAVTRRIAMVRTDLDRFSPSEIGVLENHGYLRAASSVAWLMTRLAREDSDGVSMDALAQLLRGDSRPLVVPPHPELLDEQLALRALVERHSR